MQDNPFLPYINVVLAFADSQPDACACTFQKQGLDTAVSLTYLELKEKVVERAAVLTEHNLGGKNAALVYPTSIDFVVNFLACLLAGVVAVPLNLSRNRQQLMRTLIVLKDADVAAILTLEDTAEFISGVTDEIEPENKWLWLNEHSKKRNKGLTEFPATEPHQLAFIQYTSGSTSQPKGVMVSQSNIVDNQEAIKKACGHKQGLIAGGWLPQFHDMGLIGHMLQPLFLGGHYVFMPPLNFIQRPRRWLELISHYRIASSASPNFGYEHCVKFITDREDLSGIDLSCWTVALNGSEPVNAETMELFSDRFEANGFDEKSFFPCFGMAETTLFVSGGPVNTGVTCDELGSSQLERGRLSRNSDGRKVNVVCCGMISPHFSVRIVNPATGVKCREDEVGEIWLGGPSIAQGYWGDEEKSKEVFSAVPIGDDRQYMRTGDMGYVCDGSLFVTGRIKEMLIIRGRNIYPYDLERACNSHPKSSGTAAIVVVSEDNNTHLQALVELKKSALLKDDLSEISHEIKELIAEAFEVTLQKVHLLKPGTIPKTTSGKIKRTSCNALIDELALEKTN